MEGMYKLGDVVELKDGTLALIKRVDQSGTYIVMHPLKADGTFAAYGNVKDTSEIRRVVREHQIPYPDRDEMEQWRQARDLIRRYASRTGLSVAEAEKLFEEAA